MKGYSKIIILLSFGFSSLLAQDQVYTIAQKMPEFPGGTDSLAKYLLRNLKYPEGAKETKSYGKVYIKFIVNKLGKIGSPEVVKSSGDQYLDREALRVVRLMPDWAPGADSGKAVNVSVNIPVKFSMPFLSQTKNVYIASKPQAVN